MKLVTKVLFLNDSLRLSAAAYTYDWTDKQLIKVAVVQGLPLGIKQEMQVNQLSMD